VSFIDRFNGKYGVAEDVRGHDALRSKAAYGKVMLTVVGEVPSLNVMLGFRVWRAECWASLSR